MDIRELREHWDAFGNIDPMWAILTDPDRRGNKWSPEEFFASGRGEIATLMERVGYLHLKLARKRALDFGCGLGRLTQALCTEFRECHGVDIAASMIEGARRYNQFGERCHYHVNTDPDLSLFPDDHFDLVYTVVVLQHMQPVYMRRYLREFVRILRPGGFAVFQIPSGAAPAEPPEPVVPARPLPRAAFRARVEPPSGPLHFAAGSYKEVAIRVRNTSEVVWLAGSLPDQRFRIQLGNHWLDEAGSLLARDDGRAPLPHDVKPGQSAEFRLPVTAPERPGVYQLELDMVQETAGWFAQFGSKSAVIPVEVGAPVTPSPRAPSVEAGPMVDVPAAEPFMEMYALPSSDVFRVIDGEGGKLLHVFDDTAGGGLETIYYVSK